MRVVTAFIVFLFAVGAWLARGWYPTVGWIQSLWPAALYAAAVVILSWAVLFWPRRGKNTDPTARFFGAVALAGCLLLLPLSVAKRADSVFTAKRDAAMAKTARELRLLARQRELAALEEQRRAFPEDRFSVYEGRLEAAALFAIRRLDQEMKAGLDATAERYRAALEAHPTRGPDEWVQFRTREQLEAEHLAHTQLYSATRAFTEAVEAFEPAYLERIEALQLKPPADRVAIAELERILQLWERQQALDLRRLDEVVLAAAVRVLGILRDSWGQWQFNLREQVITFDDAATESAFRLAMAEFIEANEAIQELRKDASGPSTQ